MKLFKTPQGDIYTGQKRVGDTELTAQEAAALESSREPAWVATRRNEYILLDAMKARIENEAEYDGTVADLAPWREAVRAMKLAIPKRG